MIYLKFLLILTVLNFVKINAQVKIIRELIVKIDRIPNNPISTVYLIGDDTTFLSDAIFHNPLNFPVVILTKAPNTVIESMAWNVIVIVRVTKNIAEYHQTILLLKFQNIVIISADSLKELQLYFPIFWTRYSFRRIYGVSKNSTYTYLPFATDKIQQISTERPLPNPLSNLNGYALRTTLRSDYPRAFKYKDSNGCPAIGGYDAELFFRFLKQFNATYSEVSYDPKDNNNIPAIVNITLRKEIDISMNTYINSKGLRLSYPLKMLNLAVIVPVNGYVDPNQYFIRPFKPLVWLCIALTLIFFVSMDVLKDRYTNTPVDVWNSFSEAFLIILNTAQQKRTTRDYRLYFQLYVLAFIIENLYVIHFTSFLTVFIKVKQHDTLQDLIDNNIPVMMIDYDFESVLMNEPKPKYEKLILLKVEEAHFYSMRNPMNITKFAYVDGSDKTNIYLELQNRPMFRLMSENLHNYYLGYILHERSPFAEILNDFIMRTFSTGLIDKWTTEAIADGKRMGYGGYEGVVRKETGTPLNWHHFKFAWICWSGGMIVAVFIFIGEKCVGKIQ